MAVSFDAVGPGSSGVSDFSGTGTLSWSHVCNSSATYLLVAISVDDGFASGTDTCTYNGASMTLIGQVNSGDNSHGAGYLSVFGLASPASGSHTVAFSGPSGVDVISGGSLSFIGASSLGTPGTSQSGTSSAVSTGSVTVTSSTSGNIVTAFVADGSGFSGTPPWFTSPATTEWTQGISAGAAAGSCNGGFTGSTGSSVTVGWSQTPDWYGALAVEVQGSSAPAAPISLLWFNKV